MAPIEAAAGKINDSVLEQYWKEATAQLLACMDDIKPIFEDYLLEYAARERFRPKWEGFGPRYAAATETPFQTPTLNPAISELAMYYGNAERAAEDLKYVAALLAKIASAKEIYGSRLTAMQADLADATTCAFDELQPLQDTIGKIRDRMEGLAANEDFENALIEMDLLSIELEDFKQQLINIRIKLQFDELLAELEPRIFTTAVPIYTPVDVISQEIDKDYQKAKSAALALEFTTGINLLEGLRPKLDAYDTLLAEIEAAKTQYEAGVAEVIKRYDAMVVCEYPSMADTQQRAIDVRGEMERAAEKRELPGRIAVAQHPAVFDGRPRGRAARA